ncbi:MAG: hypothetical protein DRR08_21665 [Candidatus Parabeggiatoa sp. nov. 2]|nr:MAG: hypothetical protein B6247_23420 [Beggiatoa sp. 4572_84]RKZ56454.1 MAG: hypothetical protein DRR08_21665 [Gammaproteobacteria bacterium]
MTFKINELCNLLPVFIFHSQAKVFREAKNWVCPTYPFNLSCVAAFGKVSFEGQVFKLMW